MSKSLLSRALVTVAGALDRTIGWHRLPRPLGIITLIGIRDRLREHNLFDTGLLPAERTEPTPRELTARTTDGTFNDLKKPTMGSMGCRFGRNVPLRYTFPQETPLILEPNPRVVSRELMTRDSFIPAPTLNLLAAAWIQFEVHDWFSHGKNEPDRPWELPLADDDQWPKRPMTIPRTKRDPSSDLDDRTPPTFATDDTHWWDGSQIYGNTPEFAAKLRAGEDGKLRIGPDGLLPKELEEGIDLSGVAGNFWVGLGLLHTLFSLEHNAICDRLKAEHPRWSDDVLFDHARLVNAALMAKIHTVEWTPAIIAHPTTQLGMRINWWGIVGELARRRVRRITSSEVISGIPGSPVDHHGVPYSLTEEFVAVYRMHPLIPDEYTFRSVASDEVVDQRTFLELGVLHTRQRLEEITLPNALYSFGIAPPGAITLHNYPYFLQNLNRPDGEILDLAATDILRSRERGVPRYCQFRELFHLKRPRSFEDLTSNPQWAEELRHVYNGDLDSVDVTVGMYAEPPPKGFGFSDTAFRVFVLMASRRLKSDRFFTTDYRPEVYTQAGLDWIDQNSMRTVLLRHFPQLEPALAGVENAFAPWRRVPSVKRPQQAPVGGATGREASTTPSKAGGD